MGHVHMQVYIRMWNILWLGLNKFIVQTSLMFKKHWSWILLKLGTMVSTFCPTDESWIQVLESLCRNLGVRLPTKPLSQTLQKDTNMASM